MKPNAAQREALSRNAGERDDYLAINSAWA